MKKNIAVLFGGQSAEYSVSLASASGVIAAIDTERYQVHTIGINQQGEWYLYEGPLEQIATNTWQQTGLVKEIHLSFQVGAKGFLVRVGESFELLPLALVFPVLHGRNGEDGTVQGLLELLELPYIGCGILSSALGTDKALTHQLVASLGLKVTPSLVYRQGELLESELDSFIERHGLPLFVKPLRAGSSLGITQVTEPSDLKAALERAFEYDQTVIIEKAVPGFEVGCGIIGSRSLTVGGVDEIALAQGFFDFTEKYELISAEIHSPARITSAQREKIRQQASQIYHGLKCSGLARLDFFLQADGELYFNEINTLPGFTAHSRFPNLMQQVGLSYSELIQVLIEDGLGGVR